MAENGANAGPVVSAPGGSRRRGGGGEDHNRGGCRGEANGGPTKIGLNVVADPNWIPDSLKNVSNVARLSNRPPFDMSLCTINLCVPLPRKFLVGLACRLALH